MYQERIVSRSAMLFAAVSTAVFAFVAPGNAAAQSSCPRVDLALVEPRASSETRPVTLGDLTIRLLDAATDRDGQGMALAVDDDAWVVFTREAPNVIGPDGSRFRISSRLLTRAQRLVESIQGCTAEQRVN